MGAYLSCYAPFIPFIGAGMSPGVYDIAACHVRVRGVYTNSVPVDAYRGAGRPEASYVIERLVDVAAHELGIAPDVLRRRNFIKPAAMPYTTATGKAYDSGDFAAHLKRAQALGDWKGIGHRASAVAQARASARHRDRDLYRGLRQQRPGDRDRAARPGRRHHRADRHAVDRPRPPHGLCAIDRRASALVARACARAARRHRSGGDRRRHRRLELDPLRRRFRSPARPDRLADRLKTLAANLLEAAASDLEFADGAVRVVGTDRAIAFADLAQRAGAR